VKNVLAALLVAGSACALSACGGTSVTGIGDPVAPHVTVTLRAPTTTTVLQPRVGDTLICKSKGRNGARQGPAARTTEQEHGTRSSEWVDRVG
jgi:hypothetical protein